MVVVLPAALRVAFAAVLDLVCHGVAPERAMRHVNGVPAHLVAADGLKFRPRLLLDTHA